MPGRPHPTLDLASLSVAQKLRLMESLWADMERSPEQVPSPGWHREVLEERAAEYKGGRLKTGTLAEVKERLRTKHA